jgi:hypothetical protein
MNRICRLPAALLLVVLPMPVHAVAPPAPGGPKIDFNRDIRPILAGHCWNCHGPDEKAREGDLRLDVRADAVARREGRPAAIVPGNPDASLLIRRIEHARPARRMPPAKANRPLSAEQIQLLRRWITQGAEYNAHWAFVAPGRLAVPATIDRAWPRNAIDSFILARLEKEGLKPSAPASRETLLRRVTLDLTGLPPTLVELDNFLADSSPNAYEKVVDRLLSSPRRAERVALAWLDAARYADTNGYNNDEERTMWPWRDWVLRAFAANMPYDRFVTEQLAGDLLPGTTRDQRIATGFNRNHVITTEGGIIDEEYRVEYVADRVHTFSTVFLGLSMQCARCHDHKYDPVTQREYYGLFAFFNNVPERLLSYGKARASAPVVEVPTLRQMEVLAELDKKRLALEATLRDKTLSPAELKKRKAELAALDARRKQIDDTVARVMVMEEMPRPRDAFVLNRGQYDQRGVKVMAGVPGVLPTLPTSSPINRLGLARWLIAPEHPLTARVAVNRWWAMHFGTGLVETVEDFGVQGALPTHPELLDFLSHELIRTGWDLRALSRLIVTSAAYRQSSQMTAILKHRDPDNRLLARAPRMRLPAELVRDNALSVSGLLVERLGGPSVKPYQPGGLWEDVSVERREHYVADKGDGLYRRGLYTFWKRTCPPPGLALFDAPDRETCLVRRGRTNTPLQALALLNDPTFVEAARMLAERLLHEGTSRDRDRIALAFRLVIARRPTERESAIVENVLNASRTRFGRDRSGAARLLAVGTSKRDTRLDVSELAAWTVVASTILNLDETITRG